MSTIVLACSSLKEYIKTAMETQNVNYDIILIDRSFHIEPAKMKREIQNTLSQLPTNIDTVLVAMGFCGGTWDNVTFPFRIVIPRVDDCISMLLQTDDQYISNRKETGTSLDYVSGSNRILEKLLTGRWDKQFLVAEPGHRIRHADFFE